MRKRRILIIDDETHIVLDLVRQLTSMGYDAAATARSGEDAVEKCGGMTVDLVLMDMELTGSVDGIQAIEIIKSSVDVPVIYLVSHGDDSTFGRAKLTDPSAYLWKPVDQRQLKHACELALHRHENDPNRLGSRSVAYQTVKGVCEAIANVVELRGPYTQGHHQRLSSMAVAIAREIGLTGIQLERIDLASLVCEIGMVTIPSDILRDCELLEGNRRTLYETYPGMAYDSLKRAEYGRPIAEIVLNHRECYDGSGFPRGVRGQDIPIEARVLAIAVALEELTTHRSFRNAFPLDEALQIISRGSGTQYDPMVVSAFLGLVSERAIIPGADGRG